MNRAAFDGAPWTLNRSSPRGEIAEHHVDRLPLTGRDDDRGLPDGRPSGPGVVVGPDVAAHPRRRCWHPPRLRSLRIFR